MAFGISAGTYLAAGATLLGSSMASKSAAKASQAQTNSAQAGQQAENDALNRQLDLQEPFRQTGIAGNKRLAELLGISQDIPLTVNDLTGQDLADYNAQQAQLNGINPLIMGIGNERMRDIPSLMSRRDAAEQAQQAILKRAGANRPQQTQSSDYGRLTRDFTQEDINTDPVYQSGLQFGLDEGTKGINARALQGGGYDSGATLKALTRYGNDYGSTKANESFNRFQTQNTNLYNRLAGISGTGQTATNNVSNAVQNYGNTSANLSADAGNARAAGIVSQGNSWAGALGDLSGIYNQEQNRKQNQSNFDRYFGSRTY